MIDINHPVIYAHPQNGLAKSLIEYLQLIIWLLLMKTTLYNFTQGYAIMHVDPHSTYSW